MKPQQNIYFIAIVPPPNICEEIKRFKEDVANRFNSRKALPVIPHITLIAPFLLPAEAHSFVQEWFSHIVIDLSSFVQTLDGFGAFKKKNSVLFVKPVVNEWLLRLQKELLTQFKTQFPFIPYSPFEEKFVPHITIAYRDLTQSSFEAAWPEYASKSYKASFLIKDFQLLQHKNGRWNILQNHPLQHE